MTRRRKNNSDGIALIELLVVLMILGLLAGLVGPQVLRHLGGAKSDTAQLRISEFGAGLDLFHLEVGRYPTGNEGLEALVEAPPSVSNWHGPYLKKRIRSKDPWGNNDHYHFPGEHSGPYDLFSNGTDNAKGAKATTGIL